MKMRDMSLQRFLTSRERAAAKRRANSIKGALAYLNSAVAQMPRVRIGTAKKQVCESAQPMNMAKALVKEWQSRKRISDSKPIVVDDRATCIQTAYAMELGHSWPAGHRDRPLGNQPDFSAAQEARISLIRRQHPVLQGVAEYEGDLGSLERKLLTGKIGQARFDKRCKAIAERELPEWMQTYTPPVYLVPNQSPIQRIPSNVLHKALGCEGVGVGESSIDVTGSIPEFMVRRKI